MVDLDSAGEKGEGEEKLGLPRGFSQVALKEMCYSRQE